MAGGSPFSLYNASKAALEGLPFFSTANHPVFIQNAAATEVLSVELAPFNIRALIIEPGYFPTNFFTAASANDVRPERATGAYPDSSKIPSQYAGRHLGLKQVGDVSKAAARIFDVVSGTGLAKDFVDGGRRDFVRVLLGPDCATRIRAKLELLSENVEATQAIWSSTDMDEEKLNQFAQQS
jgi:NAD(P)-dependent dehydrogenase (short-subunit alcohol dehydrogenase family)